MDEGTWVQLNGGSADLDAIAELFRSSIVAQRDNTGATYLLMGPTVSGVYDAVLAAQERLEHINGIARLYYPNHRVVSAGLIRVIDSTGNAKNVITGRASIFEHGHRVSATGIVGTADGVAIGAPTPLPFGDRLLLVVDKNPDFKRALALYANDLTWAELYKVYEVIKEAHGGPVPTGWVSKTMLTAFTATANSYPALGRDARHAVVQNSIPAPRMTLQEAKSLIHTLLRHWSEDLLSEETTS